jgi:hypothetical protein
MALARCMCCDGRWNDLRTATARGAKAGSDSWSRVMAIILYKYLPFGYALQAIQEGKLKVGMLNELNDPYDCLPVFEGIDGSLGLQASKHVLDALSCYIGMISYSKDLINPVVWSHYADSHRGIALGFKHSDHDDIVHVEYQDERPIFGRKLLEGNGESQLRQAERLVSVKATSWKYENEARRMVHLKNCKMQKDLYFEDFGPNSLCEVVLGARCAAQPPHLIRLLQQYGYDDVKLKGSLPGRDTFAMSVVDLPTQTADASRLTMNISITGG